MERIRKTVSVLLLAALCLCLLPTIGLAAPNSWEEPGNSDLNILNGGVMLNDGDDFYFTHDGIFVQKGEQVTPLSADKGKNLNKYDGYIYYTLGAQVKRLPASGGDAELLHTANTEIKQMYVLGGELLYLAGGKVYSCAPNSETAEIQSELNEIMGLIPTPYGNIYLTGDVLNYTVWAESASILSGVSSCYTDSGYLVISKDNKDHMAELKSLFDGFDASSELLDFDLHGSVSAFELLSPDDENKISEYNDNNDLMLDFNALLNDAGLVSSSAGLMAIDPVTGAEIPDATAIIPEVSEGQKNIVKRARQLHEIEWTPLEDRYQWDSRGIFKAETTYKGLPYSQPVNTNGYVGYGLSLETYASSVLDNTSKFYTVYSSYNKIAPSFGTDCSGYVSYAWGLSSRKTTYSLPQVSQKVGDQSLYSLQIGDCLNKTTSHVVLVSGITYDGQGNIVGLEIMEQTPVITRLTRYGQGESRSLASFQSYYLNSGYDIYRYTQRDSVTYTPSPVVPLDGEYVDGMKDKAPKSRTSSFVGGKSVELTSDTAGAAIYYTLDGSTPTQSSARYSGPINIYQTTKLRAIAVSGQYAGSTILEYTVKVPQADTPTGSIQSGVSQGNLVSSGSTVALSSTKGAKIYYTTDGSEPTTASKVYSSPISITQDTTIKAMAQGNGVRQSQTAVLSYKIGKIYQITASAGTGGSISPSGNSQVMETGSKTITISPATGYAIADVLVDGVSVGAVSSYTFSNVNANHTISASFKASSQLPFTDVSSNSWFYDAVSFTHSTGLFNGTTGTTFSPDTNMSRGMFATVLGRFAKVPEGIVTPMGVVSGSGVNIRKGPSTDTEVVGFVTNKNTAVQVLSESGGWYQIKYGTVVGYIRNDLIKVYKGNFTDLPSNLYYTPYVQWIYLTEIANGVSSSSFAPENNVTREQMCVMLYNYAKVYGKTLPQSNPQANFTDDGKISAHAKTPVYALQQAGVIDGMGDGSFAPQGTATRAQVAQIFKNFSNNVVK